MHINAGKKYWSKEESGDVTVTYVGSNNVVFVWYDNAEATCTRAEFLAGFTDVPAIIEPSPAVMEAFNNVMRRAHESEQPVVLKNLRNQALSAALTMYEVEK